MPIKPKHNITKEANITPAGRQFTDREELTEAFRKKIPMLGKEGYSILSYYGVGGIGKSTLRKEIGRILSTDYPDIIWSCTDFELQPFREAETSLYHLRRNLREKYKIQFPTFDIAYTVYWQKTHPQITIAKENIPFLEDGTVVSDLIAHTGGIPIVGLLPSIAKAVYKGQGIFKKWWTKRGQKELYDLPSLSPKEILDRLPMYFALDLTDHLQSNRANAVIFIDTYEALWENSDHEGGFFLRDEWIRELVAHLPSVLWVILGREKLRWNELDNDWDNYVEQHLLGGLSEIDSARFLNSCGITDEKIQNIITGSSQGIPYYLDLAVDTFLQIKQKHNREPEQKDFAKNPREVLTRFLRYLDKSEIETLKVLSVAQHWNREIFKLLIDEYKTGYPISAMKVLCRFSFIDETSDKTTFVLHDLMKQGLQAQLDYETKENINKLLFDYYCKRFTGKTGKELIDGDCAALKEAFYHGKNSLRPEELQQWFDQVRAPFDEAAKWSLLSPLYEELLGVLETTIGKNTPEYAFSVTYYSSVLYNLGEYKKALELIEKNLDDLKNALANNENLYASLLNNLATIYYYRGEIQRSKEMYEQVI
ncbi:MAG: tetratricopeptide repeat protein, partial [Ignavibacteria bacterium]|nr:tetratricopeptide repeat protein [Ignavibacteria bacterium]